MPPPPETDERLYTYDELAADMKVTKRTVRNWVSAGRIPVRRFTRKTVRITQSARDAFLAGDHGNGHN